MIDYPIVEKVSSDYVVWNIGSKNTGSDEHIPFCKMYPGTYQVIDISICLVKVPKIVTEKFHFASIRYDICNLSTCMKAMKSNNKEKRTLARELYPYYLRITK